MAKAIDPAEIRFAILVVDVAALAVRTVLCTSS
jgi:hypothetical protein